MSFFVSDITRGKLILLYFFNATNFELTNDQISRITIENDWCGYFELQQSLAELTENGLLALVKRPSGECYGISEAGRHALCEFSARLPQSVRDGIDAYVKESRDALNRKAQHTAAYTRVSANEYIVRLKIIEGPLALMTMTLNVVSKDIAQRLCENWETRAQDVYLQTLGSLTADSIT